MNIVLNPLCETTLWDIERGKYVWNEMSMLIKYTYQDPFFRKRPQENRVERGEGGREGRGEGGREGRGLSIVREEVLSGLERPLQQRMSLFLFIIPFHLFIASFIRVLINLYRSQLDNKFCI